MKIRDEILEYSRNIRYRSNLNISKIIQLIGINKVKYYNWIKREGVENQHNGNIPKKHWLTPDERAIIIQKAKNHIDDNKYSLEDGYRRITYMGIDANLFACSSSTVYRVLRQAGLLKKWKSKDNTKKGTGYKQPTTMHQEWHTDIKYINFFGTFIYFMGVIDGYSRYLVHHEVRMSMTEYDVQIVIQRALEKYPNYKPKIITDNGSQYISIDFKLFMEEVGSQHVRISPAYPQANGKIERLHRTLEEECLRKTSMVSIQDARLQIAEYVDYYNNHRLHSAIDYLRPVDLLNGNEKELLAKRKDKITKAKEARKRHWSNKNIAA